MGLQWMQIPFHDKRKNGHLINICGNLKEFWSANHHSRWHCHPWSLGTSLTWFLQHDVKTLLDIFNNLEMKIWYLKLLKTGISCVTESEPFFPLWIWPISSFMNGLIISLAHSSTWVLMIFFPLYFCKRFIENHSSHLQKT